MHSRFFQQNKKCKHWQCDMSMRILKSLIAKFIQTRAAGAMYSTVHLPRTIVSTIYIAKSGIRGERPEGLCGRTQRQIIEHRRRASLRLMSAAAVFA